MGSRDRAAIAGLLVVSLWLLAPLWASSMFYLLTDHFSISPLIAWVLVIFGHNILLVAAILAIVWCWESKPPSSVGLKRIAASDLWNGFILFVLFSVATDVTQLVTSPGAARVASRAEASLAAVPIWFGTIRAVTNGIAEELACRAYGIERLEMLTGSTWQAAGVAYCACVLSHCPVWGIHGALAMAPGQLAFVYCYVKWRSLPACALGHVLADLFGGVVWPRLPSDWQRRYWEFLSSSLPMR